MRKLSVCLFTFLVCTLVLSFNIVQAQTTTNKNPSLIERKAAEFRFDRIFARARANGPAGFSLFTANSNGKTGRSGFALAPMGTAASTSNVFGSGTTGRLSKFIGLTSGHGTIADSIIFESQAGLIGIGTDTPASKLTVNGMIQTTLGGYKFPDGTVQTTAAVGGLQVISHDLTLSGNGTQGSPLSVSVPLFLTATQPEGEAIVVKGGNLPDAQGIGGSGISGTGGDANNSLGGVAGSGVSGNGGNSLNQNDGGTGVTASGGAGFSRGGRGVLARGGGPLVNGVGSGGAGVVSVGGDGKGTGYQGGDGILAVAGQGVDGAGPGLAGLFEGKVQVNGDLSVSGTKNFKIDHPLDPENKYLYHAAIESSEVLNIYSGNAKTDSKGVAVVTLPDWFEAVNRDYRYQLTVVGTFAQAIVADEIKNNHFQIKTNAGGVKVSWQVTGIRSDAVIRNRPFKVEEDKVQSERGYYLVPEAYGEPEERGIEWARNTQLKRERH